MRVSSANFVGLITICVSNMNASVSLRYFGLELRLGRPLVSLGVGTVAGHAVVQACAARYKPLRLGVVLPEDQAHEFVHHVAMKPGRPEGMFGYQPARRKDREVHVGGAGNRTRSEATPTVPVWPVRVSRDSPVVGPHRRAVWSVLVVARRVPSWAERHPPPAPCRCGR